MRTLILVMLFGLFSNICYPQASTEITEKRNIFNEKGDFYFDKKDFKKAISYYNLAYQNDTTDYLSVLKKAEAFAKLKWYRQAEQCYRIIFESNLRINNTYKLKYALVLLANNKPDEFKQWIGMYNQVVEEEIKGDNYLVSSEDRIKLYKDSSIVLVSDTQKPDTVNFRIKYAGYQFRRKPSVEDNQIYLVLSNGDEHSITASATNDFKFSFQPMEDYRLIIQHENIMAEDILNNKKLTPAELKRKFLNPPPIQKDELILQKGMKYQFSSGKYKITPEYLNTINQLAGKYQSSGANTVDLTALVKELQLADGEIYTIKFTKQVNPDDSYKKMEISTVTMNDKAINIYGQSFLLVLPDRAKENFAIQTAIEELEKNFSPKKYAMKVDDSPLFKAEEQLATGGLLLNVNTNNTPEVPSQNRLSAKEISIIPGTEYILTLSKPNPNRKGANIEIIVPLTRGVKYNLNSSDESDAAYKKALAEFLIGREGLELANEEVIDISVLSKELEVQPGDNVSFTLLPAKQLTKKPVVQENIESNLTLDGRVYGISRDEKYSINIPFPVNRKLNFQTDLNYMKENFKPDAYTLNLDTVSFTSEIKVDTTGYGKLKSTGWLCVSVNTNSVEEVERQDQFIANDVSIITGNDYILTVSKIDAVTRKKDEIIIPLLKQVKYDFTSNPGSEEVYKNSIREFLAGRKDIETVDGTVIDITLLSKELKLQEGDEISFSLLPVKKLSKTPTNEATAKSSLFLDNKVVEFTQIQKYSINMPLSDDRQVNVQTNIEHLQVNYDPGSFTVDIDSQSFFCEIAVDTAGLGNRAIKEPQIKDPVFDVITVNFNLNEYALSPEAKKTIQEYVIDELNADSRLYVTIKGYTDALGDADYNLNLSKKRAESVKDFLRSNGIGESRIRTISYGASQLLNKNINWKELSELELRKYRKVEIVIYLPK